MRLQISPNSKHRLLLAFLGSVQGGGFYFLFMVDGLTHWQREYLTAFTIFGIFFIQIAWSKKALIKLLSISLIFSLLFSYTGCGRQWFAFLSLSFIPVIQILPIYILLIFAQTYLEEGAFRFPYPKLFNLSWNNVFIILIAWIFVALCWLITVVGIFAFNTIGIEVFRYTLERPLFVLVFTTTTFGVGLALGKEYTRIINNIRYMILALFKFLLIPLVVMGLVFFIVLSINVLWFSNDIYLDEAASALLVFTGLAIVFVNGAFQEGNQGFPYNRWLGYLINLFFLVLPLFPLSALYVFGNTIHLFFSLMGVSLLFIFIFLFILYTTGYSMAVLFSKQGWMSLIAKVNVWMAPIVAGVFLLLCSPIYAWIASFT